MRRLRFAVQTSWLALHAVTIALVVTMILLGRWQLTVSEDKGFSLQNFGYALQWWAFSVFVVGMWARSMVDAYRKHGSVAPSREESAQPSTIDRPPVAYRHYVMPTTTATPADDPVHNAYNAYLAGLAAADATTEDLR